MKQYSIREASKILGLRPHTTWLLTRKYGLGTKPFGRDIALTEAEVESLKTRPLPPKGRTYRTGPKDE